MRELNPASSLTDPAGLAVDLPAASTCLLFTFFFAGNPFRAKRREGKGQCGTLDEGRRGGCKVRGRKGRRGRRREEGFTAGEVGGEGVVRGRSATTESGIIR